MKPTLASLAAIAAFLTLLVAGCAQAAPPAPAQAPAAPTKAVEPTTAAASGQPALAQPTAAPAAEAAWPEKGKPITIIVPWPAGNANDLVARIVADAMSKDLGTPVEVVNKAGAGTQTGLTELVKSKPDGYTLLVTSTNTTVLIYLDPSRQAIFTRKDFQPIASWVLQPMVVTVRADGPYKTLQDLMNAAKTNPGKVTVGDGGFMTPSHILTLAMGKAAGGEFAPVHFNGSAEATTSLLGGHIDAISAGPADVQSDVKAGTLRILGLTDTVESPMFPGVKTLSEQGYNIVMMLSRGMCAPAGTPKEVVDVLNNVSKKIGADPAVTKKLSDAGLWPRFMDETQYTAHWNDLDAQTKPLIELAKQEPTPVPQAPKQ